ncbi:MAG: ribonuclease HI [Bacillota bacterium]|nr:ribonuclease HI [Bacillota bacterium]
MPDKTSTLTRVTIYTDGACSGNPGVGGYGALLEAGGHVRELSGSEAQTTNNRMELTAVIEALKLLKRPCRVEIYSDSAYVVNAFTKGWIDNWKRRGWRNAAGQEVANRDLWEDLLRVSDPHVVSWHKVRGHADDARNIRADQLAVDAVREHQSRMS